MFSSPSVRRLTGLLTAAVAVAVMAPAVAGAHARTYGATTLRLDPGTAAALTSLGVTPGVIAPASATSAGLSFPITDSPLRALHTGTITHSGGISLTAGSTQVDLTDFWINLAPRPNLSAEVGGARVSILSLDLSRAPTHVSHGVLTLGPVTASLTQMAADALNSAFGVTAFTKGLVLGAATVNYRLFSGHFW